MDRHDSTVSYKRGRTKDTLQYFSNLHRRLGMMGLNRVRGGGDGLNTPVRVVG